MNHVAINHCLVWACAVGSGRWLGAAWVGCVADSRDNGDWLPRGVGLLPVPCTSPFTHAAIAAALSTTLWCCCRRCCCHQAAASNAAEARKQCSHWQAQAQDSLATIQRLQELLAEAASWGGDGAAGADAGAGGSVAGTKDAEDSSPEQQQQQQQAEGGEGSVRGVQHEEGASDGEVGRLRAAMLQQQVQVASLELQVKVLSTQLLRGHAAQLQAGSSTCQLLSGVEGRLLALRTRTGRAMMA